MNIMDTTEWDEKYTHLAIIAADPEQAQRAAMWWGEARPDWPLDRAVRVWLTYEANAWWADNHTDNALYDRFATTVLEVRREMRDEEGA